MVPMEWFAPVYATVVTGIFLATVFIRPRGVVKKTAPWLWIVLFALGAAFVAVRSGPHALTWMARAAGAVCFAGAAWMAWQGSRARGQAQALLGGKTLLEGRVHSVGTVTSPGGIVCAAYQARVFEADAGEPGSRLFAQQEAASKLVVDTALGRVEVLKATACFGGPATRRHCQVAPSAEFAGREAVVDGMPPVDAVSVERVAKLGDECFLVGTLETSTGVPSLKGSWELPALIVFGDREPVARRLVAKARMAFVSSLGLCALAAFLFARF